MRASRDDKPVILDVEMGRIKAGLIRIPIIDPDHDNSHHDTRVWAPFDLVKLKKLPVFQGHKRTKQRMAVVGDDKILDAAAEMEKVDYCKFSTVIKNGILWMRVYLTPYPSNTAGVSKLSPTNRIMWRLLRAWDWDDIADYEIDERGGPLVMLDRDPRDISTIYQNLNSPSITNQDKARLNPVEQNVVEDLLSNVGPAELNESTTRYKYQTNSVIRMILQERAPSSILDPAFYELEEQGCFTDPPPKYWTSGPTGRWQTRRSRAELDQWELPKGGLLCEEMGVGKTLISLCLILATKHLFPAPPEGDHSETVTQTAVDKFPFPQYSAFRAARYANLGRARYDVINFMDEEPTGAPSLRDLAMNKQRCNAHKTSPEMWQKADGTSVAEMMRDNPPFFYIETVDEEEIQRLHNLRIRVPNGDFNALPKAYKRVFRSNCTLIVVPSLLIPQWKGQIQEHFPKDTFRYRVIDAKKRTAMPGAREVVDLDILIVAKEKFAREKIKTTIFSQVAWKRILVDEGHFGANGLSGVAVKLLASLLSESRWLITGTPATHLIGNRDALPNVDSVKEGGQKVKSDDMDIDMDMDVDADVDMDEDEDQKPEIDESTGEIIGRDGAEDIKPSRRELEGTEREGEDEKPDLLEADDEEEEEEVTAASAWGKEALADLTQIGKMFSDFFKSPIFESRGFNATYKNGLGNKRGPLTSSVMKLENLFQKTLIRNRAADIEAENELPKMTVVKTGLVMSKFQALTYNFMQAVVARHAVTTTGATMDSLFKTKKRITLLMILNNLQATGFWYVGGASTWPEAVLTLLVQMEGRIRLRIEEGREKEDRSEDLDILTEAQGHIQAAIADEHWLPIMMTESLPIEIMENSLPKEIMDGWAQCDGGASNGISPDGHGLITAQHLIRVQDHMKNNNAEIPENHLVGLRRAWVNQKAEEVAAKEAAEQAKKDAKTYRGRLENLKPKPKTKPKGPKPAMLSALLESGKANRREFAAQMQREEDFLDDDVIDVDAIEDPVPSTPSVPLLFSTMSAKANWIVDEIQKCVTDTFVIFSKELNNLAFLKEALDVAHISICHVSMDSVIEERQANLLLFQTGRKRVCLMDLALAARGLNLIVANRVIFCEPVWKKDVEAQALKRIHRIGQKRACFSNTLYMKDTIEETKLVARESADGLGDDYTDATMRGLIRHPKFYNGETGRPPTIRTSLTGGPIMTPEEIASAVVAGMDPGRAKMERRMAERRKQRGERVLRENAARGQAARLGRAGKGKGKERAVEVEVGSDVDELADSEAEAGSGGEGGKRKRGSTISIGDSEAAAEGPVKKRRVVTFE